MLSSKVILVLFIWNLVAPGTCDLNDCPRFCLCDVHQQLNRAECSSRRLISAELDVPNVVQVLDLSYNNIPSIESNCLKSYRHLKYLNLSHNAIFSLELESFSRLTRILDIDLSYNRLQYLDDRLLERNRVLRKLNLEGNKFMTLALKPLLRSNSLEEVILRNSQINFIQKVLFIKLPNLKDLDLSQNLLNTFLVEDFSGMPKLRKLKLSENSIRCDHFMQDKIKELQIQGLTVDMDECNVLNVETPTNVEKFQKMSMLPQQQDVDEIAARKLWRFNLDTEDEDSQEEDEHQDNAEDALLQSNEWLRVAPAAALCGTQKFKLCQNYRKCLETLNGARQEKRTSRSFTATEAKFGFFLGVTCGVTAAIVVLTCALCVKSCYASKRKAHLPHLEVYVEPRDRSSHPFARPPQQVPPQVRRQPRRRAPAAPPRPSVRYEGPVGENFISRLFGRPARRQYYRTINQNTATLIRRLSLSNLINNRLNSNALNHQSSQERPAVSEVENGTPSAPRPETPPPSYGDVVLH